MCEEIVSWVTAHQYPIRVELFSFYAFTLVLPLLLSLRIRYGAAARARTSSSIAPECARGVSKPFLLVACAGLYIFLFDGKINRTIDLFHEGEFLVPGFQAAFSKRPYLDVYLQHGIGRNYLPFSIASMFFEGSLLGLRYVQQLLEPLAYICLFLLGVSAFRYRLMTSLVLVLLLSGYDYWLGFRQGIGMAAIAALLLALRDCTGKMRIVWSGLSGALSVLALLYSLEIGLYVIAASIFSLLVLFFSTKNGRSELFMIARGYLITLFALVILFSLSLLHHGLFSAALQNTFEQVSCQAKLWGLAYPNPFDVLSAFFNISSINELRAFFRSPSFRMWLPLPVFFLSFYWLLRRYKAGEQESQSWKAFLVLYVCSLAYYRTALGRSDYGHWIDGSAFVWVLLVFLFEDSLFAVRALWSNSEAIASEFGYDDVPQLLGFLAAYCCCSYIASNLIGVF